MRSVTTTMGWIVAISSLRLSPPAPRRNRSGHEILWAMSGDTVDRLTHVQLLKQTLQAATPS